jgi:hypothetical protein
MLTVSTPSNAQQDLTITPKAYLSFRPNIIGVGQEMIINMWLTPSCGAHRQYHGYVLTITGPDGKSESFSFDSYVADSSMWMPFYPDQVGEWSFQFTYPGEYFAPGTYTDGILLGPNDPLPTPAAIGGSSANGGIYANYTAGVTVKPASTGVQKLTVQQDMIPSWSESPFPTDYWTRPVDEINRDWWPIVGSYPWFGPVSDMGMWNKLYPDTNPAYNSEYAFVPWVTGPESAHVVWKRQYALSGLMGGDLGIASYITGRTGGQGNMFLPEFRDIAPQIILMGRAYNTYEKVSPDGPTTQRYWECYDIRTGEVYWERPLYPGETAPNLIEWVTGQTSVPGAEGTKTVPSLLSISNGYLRKYHPFTGAMTANVSIAPMTGSGGTYYKNGFVLGIQDLGANAGAERYRLINWTTESAVGNFADRVISNETYARSALPTAALIDWNVGIGCTLSSVSYGGIYVGQNITAYSLSTGVVIWNKYIEEPQYSGSACVADHGKLAVLSANGYYLAFDLRTGNEVWRTRTLDYPWDAPGFGSYSVTSGYGQLYWMAQTGVYAIDWNTGNINWKHESNAPPFETPFTGSEGQTVYPSLNAGICADGKIYMYLNRHTPEQPFYRGMPTLCIDVFTGKEVWSVGISGGGDMRRTEVQLAVADGYLATAGRDGFLYVYGMGKSEITLLAPQTSVTVGQKALLTGTILDMSPAQSGAPCVSKDSMAAQMEQMHIGASVGGIYGNVTLVGVPVSIDAVDPNGNYVHVADVISDGYSGTFSYAFAPKNAGEYTITATFMGDESYGSSFATTYLTVAEGADSGTNNTVLYAVIGATVAIIVVMVLCFLIFRKK